MVRKSNINDSEYSSSPKSIHSSNSHIKQMNIGK